MQYTKGNLSHTCDWDDQCGQQFASRDDVERHQIENHWSGNTCGTCGFHMDTHARECTQRTRFPEA